MVNRAITKLECTYHSAQKPNALHIVDVGIKSNIHLWVVYVLQDSAAAYEQMFPKLWYY